MSTIRFQIKPSPVIPEHRPLYKIAQILLVLALASRGGKSSLPRLQLFNWALKTADRAAILLAAVETGHIETAGWGFDPAVPIALRLAVADGLLDDVSAGYSITSKGSSFIDQVVKAGHLGAEKSVLDRLGKKITEAMVNEIAKKWEE